MTKTLYTMNELKKFIQQTGIVLSQSNKIFPFPHITTPINSSFYTNFPSLQNESKKIFNFIFNELYRSKQAIEVASFNKLTCLVSREVFIYLYAIQIERNTKNKVYLKPPKKYYTNFEREVYNAICTENILSKKLLILSLNISTKKMRKMLQQALDKLWKKLWIIKIRNIDGCNLWQTTLSYDKQILRKGTALKRETALENLIVSMIKACSAISRNQLKYLLKNIASEEEIDKTITSLILKKIVQINQSIVINGKKALSINPKL